MKTLDSDSRSYLDLVGRLMRSGPGGDAGRLDATTDDTADTPRP
jgi:hypothetical protein